MRRATFRVMISLVVTGALVLSIIGMSMPEPRSPFVWLEYPLLIAMGWGLISTRETGAQSTANFARFVGLSWLLGMLVEMTLTVDGSGIGGIHRDTFTSFVLAQGDYIPLAVVFWLLHRRLGYGVVGGSWVAIGMALTEGLVFTGSLTSAMVRFDLIGSILVASYLAAIYMVYLVLPLRLAGIGSGPKTQNVPILLAAGFVAAFCVRVFWGFVYSPMINGALNLVGV